MLAYRPAGEAGVFSIISITFLVLQVIIWVLIAFGTQTFVSGTFIKSSLLQPFINMFSNKIYSGNNEKLSSNSSSCRVQLLGNWSVVQLDETKLKRLWF